METKFTKGEWIIRNDSIGVVDKSDSQSYGMIKEVCWLEEMIYSDIETVANAHLIAASPEMYEMLARLSEMMPLLDEQTHPNIEMDAVKYDIDKLLAKARGES